MKYVNNLPFKTAMAASVAARDLKEINEKWR